jgi:hypothetical protein
MNDLPDHTIIFARRRNPADLYELLPPEPICAGHGRRCQAVSAYLDEQDHPKP